MKEQKGITLVALIITIIVLIILAVVAIAAVSGNGGLINRSKKAANDYTRASQNEQGTLSVYTNEITKANPSLANIY